MLFSRDISEQNDSEKLEIKGYSKVFQTNGNTKKTWTAKLISK